MRSNTYSVPEIRALRCRNCTIVRDLSRLKLLFEECVRFQWLIGWDVRKTGLYPIGYRRGISPGMKIFTDLLAPVSGEDNTKTTTE